MNSATAGLQRLVGRVDADRAVLLGERDPLRLAAGRDHLRAGAAGDLHAVDAEAADAEDQHPLPDADPALADQAVVHAGDGIGQNRRGVVGESVAAGATRFAAGTAT